MKTMHTIWTCRLQVSAVVAAAVLAGCVSNDKPYSYLQPKSSISTEANLWPVRVEFVDGTSTLNSRVQVEPGLRKFRAVSLQQDGFNNPKRKDLTLEVEPCKTYELAAKHTSRYNPDWELRIVKVRDEVGCQKKFADRLGTAE